MKGDAFLKPREAPSKYEMPVRQAAELMAAPRMLRVRDRALDIFLLHV